MTVAKLNAEQQELAVDMMLSGATRAAVAAHFCVTKNTITGIWSRRGMCELRFLDHEPTTLGERCDALNAVLDAVLAETRAP